MDTTSAEQKLETISGEVPTPAPPPKGGPFFTHADWQSFGGTALVSFTVYCFTLCPSIELGMSGNFATGAMYAGVPDTPGFPLWTIYAHLSTVLIPFGNVAWRISISSALASALACGLIALMASRCGALILASLPNFRRLDERSGKWLRIVSGCVAGMSFGLSNPVWGHSVIVDWWPLTFAMFAAVICLLTRWSFTPEKTRYLYAAFFLYGLALTNSQSLIVALFGLEFMVLLIDAAVGRDLFTLSALLFIPVLFWSHHYQVYTGLWAVQFVCAAACFVLALTLAIATRRILTRWKTALGCVALTVIGLCLYFYCAIASMTNPPMNWGYPHTVEGFFHLVERGQYEVIYPTAELSRYWMQIKNYGDYVFQGYGWLYLIPGVMPFFMLHRMRGSERRWLFGLLAVFLCESFFLLALINLSNDKGSRELNRIYFAPSFLILAIWAGCGLMLIGTMLARPRERKIDRFKPPGESPPDNKADEKTREDAWKQLKEISKKI